MFALFPTELNHLHRVGVRQSPLAANMPLVANVWFCNSFHQLAHSFDRHFLKVPRNLTLSARRYFISFIAPGLKTFITREREREIAGENVSCYLCWNAVWLPPFGNSQKRSQSYLLPSVLGGRDSETGRARNFTSPTISQEIKPKSSSFGISF